jgi:hypothetical protein
VPVTDSEVAAWQTDLVTDLDLGFVARAESPEAGGAIALDVSVLTGRTWKLGPYLRGRHDFAVRPSGGGGVVLSFPLSEDLVLAPSAGALTDGTAGFGGRVFIGVRASYPTEDSFRFAAASLGVSVEARAFVDGRRDTALFLTANPVTVVALPIILGVWITTGRMPGH